MSSFVVSILEDFLGSPRHHRQDKGQISFDCPACSEGHGLIRGDGKGNLEVNYEKGVFKCWACKDTNNMHGYIPKLIRKYGSKKHLKQYLILCPDFKKFDINKDDKEKVIVELPESYLPLSKHYPYDKLYNEAIYYLSNRGITKSMIDYYNLGYTTKGKHFNRIVVPSIDCFGELNYYAARSFNWVKPKYLNFEGDKKEIIFNEGKINWDSTIYLVEGPFDHIVTPNSIPLLGKYISDLLLNTLIEKAKANVVIVLDDDAKKDAENLFKTLFYSRLCHLVRIVFLPEGYDIALIHERFGKRGVMKVLSTARRLDGFNIL